MSPLFVSQLIAALQDNWSKYATKALPQDIAADFQIELPGAGDGDPDTSEE